MFLKFKPFAAPRVFRFMDPDTNRLHEASSRSQLLNLVVSYRAQNNLPPIEELYFVIENYLCTLPENEGLCIENKNLRRGFMQYYRGGLALLKNMWIKDPVPQEEADRRSSICLNCPYNSFPDRDMFIKWSDDIAVASIGDKKSANHDSLGNCSICSCPLRPKVFMKGPFDLSKEEKELLPSFCWQL